MAGLRTAKVSQRHVYQTWGLAGHLLTDFFLGTSCVFVIGVGTPGPVCQIATIARAMDTEAGVIT
jgi:hypothetical protein